MRAPDSCSFSVPAMGFRSTSPDFMARLNMPESRARYRSTMAPLSARPCGRRSLRTGQSLSQLRKWSITHRLHRPPANVPIHCRIGTLARHVLDITCSRLTPALRRSVLLSCLTMGEARDRMSETRPAAATAPEETKS